MTTPFRKHWKWLIFFLFLASCRTHPDKTRIELREKARLVLERHCGRCHIPEENPNLPQALAVYNLRDEEWAAPMTRAQLEQLKSRIHEGDFFDPFDARNKDTSPPPKPQPEEIQIIQDYVDAELKYRR